MKKFFTFFCAAMLSLSAMYADNYSVQIGDLYYNIYTNSYISYYDGSNNWPDAYSGPFAEVTTHPNKYSGKVVVPAEVEYNGTKYPVKMIGSNAFKDCSNLTVVELPDGIIRIGEYAFRECSSLLSINLPEGLQTIDYYAFYKCSSLSAIKFPESLTYIGGDSFNSCSNITSIVIPENVSYIGYNFFFSTY